MLHDTDTQFWLYYVKLISQLAHATDFHYSLPMIIKHLLYDRVFCSIDNGLTICTTSLFTSGFPM